jgi:periplasmic protein TonB
MKAKGFILALLTVITLNVFGQEENIDEDFCIPTQSAAYPGGQDSLKNFLKKNLKSPLIYKNVSGKVFVQFIVGIDGSVTEPKVIKGQCDQCDSNALEVISQMPKWVPAKKDGRPVKSRVIIPIIFSL